MATRVQGMKFSDFYEKWVGQLEDLLQLLLLVSKERDRAPVGGCEAVVNRLTAHHKEYYTSKWAAAREDVLPFFAPDWLSPLENAYLWITGWKPSTVFRLLDSLRKSPTPAAGISLAGMTEEQVKKIDALRLKIKAEEDRVEREMERQQVAVAVADRKILELARLERRVKEEGDPAAVAKVNELVEAAVKGMCSGLEKVMKMADCVRLKRLKGVLDILNPIQGIDFLVGTSMLQIHMRRLGKKFLIKNNNDDPNGTQTFALLSHNK